MSGAVPRSIVDVKVVQRTERKVGMGELNVVSGAFRLKTLLGSCVGLVLYDRSNRVGGLAHIVLPTSNGEKLSLEKWPLGKYADIAIPEMLRQFEQLNGRVKQLTARIAGGAKMFATSGPMSIGDQNIAAVEQLLKSAGIPVLGRHLGGTQGRRLAFDVDSGSVIVEVVGSPAIEL